MVKTLLSHRRKGGFSERKVNTRELRKIFLIVCEGEKTEPNYFKRFRVNKKVVVYGAGANTLSLVREAIERKKQGTYDQVWCVFDRDSFPAENFNNAISLATSKNIKIAYSNEAFELWYLLHFHYYDTAIPRAEYISKLSKLLGYKYRKNTEFIYDELLPRQNEAIRNAKRLLAQYSPQRPEQDNPSTTVHALVEALNDTNS